MKKHENESTSAGRAGPNAGLPTLRGAPDYEINCAYWYVTRGSVTYAAC